MSYFVVGSALWLSILLVIPSQKALLAVATLMAFPWSSLYGVLALLTVRAPIASVLLQGLYPLGLALNAFLIHRFIGRRLASLRATRGETIERSGARAASQGPLVVVVAAVCLIPAQFIPSLILAAATVSDARTGQWARLWGGLLRLILQPPLSAAGLVLSLYLLTRPRLSRRLPGGLLFIVSAMFLLTDLPLTLSTFIAASGWFR